ncbi:MAG: DUF433 domain-containing protein [Bacteroidota bacterium]|jgi:uncharacterized protein (DUF433 family)
MKKKTQKARMLGRYIVIDPEVCHGKPTFIGTRIMVWQVLEQLEDGEDWETIQREWNGKVTKEAIAETVRLARKAFLDHSSEYGLSERRPLQRASA